MSKTYRLVVFDWEGTLGDTLGHVLTVLADEARRLNFGEMDECLARQYVILGLARAVKKIFPQLLLHQHEQLIQAVQHALAICSTEVCLMPGALQIIKEMDAVGLKLAIATNKGHQSLQRALHVSGLDVFFSVTRAAGQVPAKPCPQMLEEILSEFDVPASQALMIGDSVNDIEMASLIGVDAIGIDFYHLQADELLAAGALEVFDNYQQVGKYLRLPDEHSL